VRSTTPGRRSTIEKKSSRMLLRACAVSKLSGNHEGFQGQGEIIKERPTEKEHWVLRVVESGTNDTCRASRNVLPEKGTSRRVWPGLHRVALPKRTN